MGFHGVNLGGWLVLERWIAPDVFTGSSAVDEHSLCQELGIDQARARLNHHRQEFITRDHIKKLSEMGLGMLRLPVGYWLFDAPEPFVSGGDVYVERLFEWASELNMRVILDVHAAPGSQNGWDHSGRAGEIGWERGDNVERTLDFVRQLAQRFGQQRVLYGIEVLNEPHWDVSLNTLIDYYLRSYQIIDELCPENVKVICSDAFRPEQVSKELERQNLPRLVLDMHLYQLFTPQDRALDLDQHIEKAAREWSGMLRQISKRLPVMVGEWSTAMSELYDDRGRQRAYSNQDYVRYFAAQRVTFDNTAIGWTYWTARTQDGGAWSLIDHPEFLEN